MKTHLVPLALALLFVPVACRVTTQELQVADRPAAEVVENGVHVVLLEGTPFERGVTHGKTLREEIGTLVASWKEDLRRTHAMEPDAFIAKFLAETDYVTAIEKWTPGLLDEVRGIAEGAGIDYETMLAFQLPDEMWANGEEIAGHHCTSLGVDAQDGRPTYVAQNLDVPRWYHLHPTVLRIRHEDSELESLVVTIPGLVGANGINNRRVAVAVNTLLQLQPLRRGLPVAFVVRGILARESHEDALKFVRSIEHASGQNYIVGGPEEANCLECSERVVARFVPFEGAKVTWHTNHPLVNENHSPNWKRQLAASEHAPEEGRYRCWRFEALERRLGSADPIDLAVIEATLCSRDEGVPIDNPSTYVSTIMILGEAPELRISAGRPGVTPFETVTF